MMKIALIDPKSLLVHSNHRLKELVSSSPNLYFYSYFWSGFSNALLTLASLTPENGVDLVYVDEDYRTVPYEEDFDIVAITATTQQAPQAYRIARRFKELHADRVTVVLGGPHVSFCSDEAAQFADVIFVGEAESSWPAFLNDYRKQEYRKVYRGTDFDPVDLSRIPVPRYDLLNHADYRMIWVQTSRGCPRDCEFCSSSRMFGHRHKTKRVEQVIEEIRTARMYMKYQQILFTDDNLVPQIHVGSPWLDAIGSLGISFVVQSDISIGEDVETLKILKDCGCSTLFIGFESIDERNLALINRNHWKQKQLRNVRSWIDNIVGSGIAVYGAFIIGYDWDTPESLQSLAEFITDNYLAGAQITVLTPLPGTNLRNRLEREGRVLDTGWENYTFFDVNIRHPNFTRDELEDGLLKLYQHVYSPEYFARKNQHYKEVYRSLMVQKLGNHG